jgi:Flp pilus assembly protein TadD
VADRPRRLAKAKKAGRALAAAVAPTPPAALPAGEPEHLEAPRLVDPMVEGERLLAQGEVVAACEKGEHARRMNPQQPRVHRFLGKCYMRAGQPDRAREHFRRYLELAPDASDAAFIKSIVK